MKNVKDTNEKLPKVTEEDKQSIHTSDSTPVAKSADGEVKKKAVQGKSIFSFLTMAPKPVSESSNSGRSSVQSSALKSVRVLNNVIIDEETRSSPSCNSP